MKIYGQEINALSASISKMNLFLHGIKDFNIVNGDTLVNPAFIEKGQLKKFDMVLANPPYSISQWDRENFANDKYGRNFLGVPPQGRADYAFIQHILKSMDEKTGRCAVLLPHGVLNRNEEKSIRENLIKLDILECIVGIGKNLFYNSPMEACVIVCRNKKKNDRKGQVLFIDAKNEITRKDSFSYLEEKHINKIVDAYIKYDDIEGFSKRASNEELLQQDSTLSISFYVKHNIVKEEKENIDLEKTFKEWKKASFNMNKSLKETIKMINGGGINE